VSTGLIFVSNNIVTCLGTGDGLLIGFIKNFQVVTSLNYNTVTQLKIITHQSFHSYRDPVSLNHTLQIKPSIHTLTQAGLYILLVYDWLGCRCNPLETPLLAPMVSRITPLHRPHANRSLYCWGLFTERLHTNGRGTDLQETRHVIPSQRLHGALNAA
jgi:hypothetical protein